MLSRYSLDHGYHVILDGILYADRYEEMLDGLRRDHAGRSFFYYLDVSLTETLRRHDTRPEATEFAHEDMRSGFRPADLLASEAEQVIPETSSLRDTTARILADAGLVATGAAEPLAPMPAIRNQRVLPA
jgi:hypothetical protein